MPLCITRIIIDLYYHDVLIILKTIELSLILNFKSVPNLEVVNFNIQNFAKIIFLIII